MKISEFKKLIREEARKIINEAFTGDKKAILKFFKYLKDDHDMTVIPEFKTSTSGYVEIIMGGPRFRATFMVDGKTLVLKTLAISDMHPKEFLEDIEHDNERTGDTTYKFQVKGKTVIVS